MKKKVITSIISLFALLFVALLPFYPKISLIILMIAVAIIVWVSISHLFNQFSNYEHLNNEDVNHSKLKLLNEKCKNVTFDEIIEQNKDVLQRLKNK